MNQGIISRRDLWISHTAIFLVIFATAYRGVTTSLVLVPIVNDLDLGSSEVQWVMNSLYITLLALLIAGGYLSDCFQKMTFLRVGIVLSLLATLLFALSTSLWMLILSRVLIGAAMAMITPVCTSYLKTTGTQSDQIRAFSYAGVSSGIAGALGFLLAGAIESISSWRWSFSIAIIVLFIAFFFTFSDKTVLNIKPKRFNFIGVILLGLSLVSMIIFLDNISKWKLVSLISFIFFIVFFGCVAAFVIWEKKASNPVLNMEMIRGKNFSSGLLLSLLKSLLMSAMYLMVCLYYQNYFAFDLSPIRTSYFFLAIGVPLFVASFFAKKVVSKVGVVNTVMVSFLIISADLYIYGFFAAGTLEWANYVIFGIFGAASGLLGPSIKLFALSDLKKESTGEGASLVAIFSTLGSSFGILITSFTYFSIVKDKLADYIHASLLFGDDHQKLEKLVAGHKEVILKSIAKLGNFDKEHYINYAKESLVYSFEMFLIVLATVVAAVVLFLLLIFKIKKEKKDLKS